MDDFVFVYGSLKQGHWNNYILGTSELVSKDQTLEDFILMDCGFPFAVEAKQVDDSLRSLVSPVQGEIYQVKDKSVIRRLDQLEGEGSMYKRRRVKIKNFCKPVWIYVAIGMTGLEYPLTKKEEGQWVWNGR